MNVTFNRLKTEFTKNDTQLAKWSILPMTILIAWIAAHFFWLIYGVINAPSISIKIPTMVTAAAQSHHSSLNMNQLAQSELFGKVQIATVQTTTPVAVEVNKDAPETRLPLILRGIYASTDDALSNAIIEDSKKDQTLYFVNDSIPGATNLTLAKVFPDRVILNRGGQFETLKMIEEQGVAEFEVANKKLALNKSNDKPQIVDKRNNLKLSNQLKSIHQKLQQDPQSLAGMMNASPVMVNGKIAGFKVSPGKDPSLFAEAGLRRNDVVTNVNGIELDSLSNGLALKEQLKTATELSIQLTRGQQQISLVYSLNENK